MDAQTSDAREQRLLKLSALADGELSRDETSRLCSLWRESSECREAWHSWSVIGDVMRSQDLASPVQHDRALFTAIQKQLQKEPVVLAPQPLLVSQSQPQEERAVVAANGGALRASPRRLGSWRAPVAVAAGCAMVAGALWVSRSIGEQDAPGGVLSAGVMATAASDAGTLLRNPELDRYLQAHRQYATAPALAAPGGIRQVVATPDGR